MLTLSSTDNQIVMQRRETDTSEIISVVAPIVNLNGATKRSLLDQQAAVIGALDMLRKALANAHPHGRDFQVGDVDGSKYAQANKDFVRELDFVNEMEARHEEIGRRLYLQG